MASQKEITPKILRIVWKNNALTARIFEENFLSAFKRGDIRVASMEQPESWEDFFSRTFEEGTFFSPNYELQPLVPWLLSLRNAVGSPLRLLFIAHAPGGMHWIWRLLPSLLRSGDRIVAPSNHAAQIIRWFMPEITPALRVIPHPVPLPKNLSIIPSEKEKRHFLVLGRLRREKCLHQLIEGYALFCEASRKEVPSLVIAGSQVDEERGTPLPYYLTLRQRVRRLGLEGRVLFPGPVTGNAKEELFHNAWGVCNLSLSLEESFGKTLAEALARGIPILATRWSAFPELVGSRGILLPPQEELLSEIPSVDPEEITWALKDLYTFPRRCFPEGEDFPWRPEKVRLQYREMLAEALEEETLPVAEDLRNRGILGRTAPLNVLSEEELFEFHHRDCRRRLRRMKGENVTGYSEAEEIQGILEVALRKSLVCLFAHETVEDADELPTSFPSLPSPKDLSKEKHPYLRGGLKKGALRSSRIACAIALGEQGRVEEARKVLNSLERDSVLSPLERYGRCIIAFLEKDSTAAWNLWKEREGPWREREEGGGWLRLGTRIAPQMGEEESKEILLTLQRWLEAFPDAPDSAGIALRGAEIALKGGKHFRYETRKFLEHARPLVGDSPLVERMELALLGYDL